MADIVKLEPDGRNWTDYHEKLFQAAGAQGLMGLLNGTRVKPNGPWNPFQSAAWLRDNTNTQYLIITTTPPVIHERFDLSSTAFEMFLQLQNLFEKPRECEVAESRSGDLQVEKSSHRRRRAQRRNTENPHRVKSKGWRDQNNNCEDTEVRHTPVVPQEPETTSQQADDAATDVAELDATCAKPMRPEGVSQNPQDQL
ncbi:hypothetical protein J3R83DRAFT_5523, partial [Lanmaoa asiatica]